LNLGIFALLARLLDTEAFGLASLAGVYVAFMQILVPQGSGDALVQRKDLRSSHLDAAFWTTFIVALFLAGVTLACQDILARLFGDLRLSAIVAWLALSLPIAALASVPTALLTRTLTFRSLATRSLAATLVGGVCAILAALAGLGVWSLVILHVVTSSTAVACLWSSVSWRPGFSVTREAVFDLAPFSAGVLTNKLLWFVSQRVDHLVIGAGLGMEALGIYALAMRLVESLLALATGPFQTVAMPAFSALQDDLTRFRQAFVRTTRLVCALSFPIFIQLFLVSPHLVPSLFGMQWQPATLPIQILCVGGLVRSVLALVHPTFMALGRIGLYSSLFSLSAALNVLGCLVAANRGIEAVAWATVVAMSITGVLSLVVINRLLDLSWTVLASTLVPIASAGACLAVAVIAIERSLDTVLHGHMLALTQVLVGTLVYASAVIAYSGPIRTDLLTVVGSIRHFTPTFWRHGVRRAVGSDPFSH
jgi:O-antigen/teichoic acid export membrane protein